MNDFDDILALVKSYYKIIIGVLVLIVLYLVIWIVSGQGGNPAVKETIKGINTDIKTNERRVDDVIDAAKAKEEEAKKDVSEKVGAVSDDKLPDLLAGLLADYRKSH